MRTRNNYPVGSPRSHSRERGVKTSLTTKAQRSEYLQFAAIMAVALAVISLARRKISPEPKDAGPSADAQPTFEREALLKEFEVLRQELLQQLNNSEQYYSYVVAISVAILGSQLVVVHFSSVRETLSTYPVILLAGAVLMLWFPASGITKLVNITVIASYFNDVLIPKLNFFALLDTAQTPAGTLIREGAAGESFIYGRPPLLWENYRAKALYPPRSRMILTPIGIMRSSLLWLPSILLIITYAHERLVAAKSGLAWYEIALLVLYCLLAAFSLLAFFAHGSLTRVHRQHWARQPK